MTRNEILAKIKYFEQEVADARTTAQHDFSVGVLLWECDAHAELQIYLEMLADMDQRRAA